MLRTWLGLTSTLALIGVVAVSTQARGFEADPENTLKTHGLKASGWLYVLESEAEFHSKIADARSLYQNWTTARSRLEEQEQEAQAIQMLGAQSNALKQHISQLRRQMSSGGYGGRRGAQLRRMRNMGVSAEISQEQANLNMMNQQLAQLKKNVPRPQDQERLEDEVSSRRQALREVVEELVKSADQIDRTYHDLHRLNEVDAALRSLNLSGRAKLRLGPSHEYTADVKILRKLRHQLSLAGVVASAPATIGNKHHVKVTPDSTRKAASPVQGLSLDASALP
jgi:myosin heavy subunit